MVFFELFSNDPNVVHIEAGEWLFRENDAGSFMYVLVRGRAEILVKNRVVEVLERGAIVGESALIDHGPRSASVLAQSDCEFVEVDEKRFHYLVAQAPFFATQVMRVLVERLRHADALIPAEETA